MYSSTRLRSSVSVYVTDTWLLMFVVIEFKFASLPDGWNPCMGIIHYNQKDLLHQLMVCIHNDDIRHQSHLYRDIQQGAEDRILPWK